ncbi:TDT family transporter [Beijerinckia indica]|uniref:C4-dicarboxylate transporter/malic acid transport protein n=1 Tax=Beijerinckia indica subsp. indica (strain ATCC 9039 / DSM 1715 / NCIMB 8712) TaxID=395963 RepID=B2IIC6_BEII9|nr:TDT family transporter [Beijerinckia indica]ACB96080.1 C4-dicarboxylate transporter/malic acid transport protein [Beijerinckia indica subsp. indica ATCC 9039]
MASATRHLSSQDPSSTAASPSLTMIADLMPLPFPSALAAPRAPAAVNPRGIVRQFTPNWFTVTMGTGVLALALNQFPIAIFGLHQIGMALWLLNIGLFVLFSFLYAARWIFFFHEARLIFRHSVTSMFFGAIPMGLLTIVNGFLAFGIPLWGQAAVSIAHILWWASAFMAVLCGSIIPFLMFTRQDHSMEKMTAIWLLPIVAAGVAASSGGLLAPYLSDPEAFQIIMVSYALWAYSVPLAMSILVILVLRLMLHKLPGKDMAASGWLALGPIGTGSLGLLLLGGDAPHVFSAAGLPGIGEIAYGLGIIGGTILWGYGLWWLLLAMLKTAHYLREGMPFNMGWWGFTFPLGVYSLATLNLARTTHLALFSLCGGAFVIMLALFWIIVAARTARGAWNGVLFVAPCLTLSIAPDRFETDAV